MARDVRRTNFAVATIAGVGAVFAIGGALRVANSGPDAVALTTDHSRAEHAPEAAGEHTKATLIASVGDVRPGETFDLALRITLSPGWHTYWPGLNDSGSPTSIDLKLPNGATAGAIVWPAPERYVSGDLLDYVFHDEAVLMIPVSVPRDAKPGATFEIKADAEWLVCKDVCLPASSSLKLSLPIVAMETPPALRAAAPKASLDALARAKAKQPTPGEGDTRLSVRWTGDVAELRYEGATKVMFAPLESSAVFAKPIANGEATGSTLRLSIESGSAKRLEGVLIAETPEGTRRLSVRSPVPSRADTTGEGSKDDRGGTGDKNSKDPKGATGDQVVPRGRPSGAGAGE
jgi:DsbC/DsbD-like thiol-disulfide interchange protein